MEPYQEIIDIEEYFFFEGLASFKYCGDYHAYLSEKTGLEQFAHSKYYDVEIDNIIQIKPESLKITPPAFQLGNIKNNQIVADYNCKLYEIDVDFLYVFSEPQPLHTQIDDNEILGEFVKVPVIFKMKRPGKAVRCKPNIQTGNIEEREDGVYFEYTTGEWDDVKQRCEMKWVKEEVCPINQPTGKSEEKENCKRIEYYSGLKDENGACETYWGEWICEEVDPPTCVQGEWTGQERKTNDWIQREYYNSDCTTYWVNHERITRTSSNLGCLNIFLLLLVTAYTIIPIYLAVKYGSFMPILFGIGIPLLLASFSVILRLFERHPRLSLRLGRWFIQLLYLLIALLLFNGLWSLFNLTNWNNNYSEIEFDSSHEIEEVKEVTPNETYIPEEIKPERPRLKVKLRWRDYDNRKYEGTYYLYKDEVADSRTNLNLLDRQNLSNYSEVYTGIYRNDIRYMTGIFTMLDSIRNDQNLSNVEFANVITSMVQSIEYVLVLDTDCNDPWVIQNKDIREMLQRGVECDGNAPYGIRTPMEFLSNLKGDCDTRTLLLYTIFKHYKYDVAIINSEYYGHSMLGMNISDGLGAYKTAPGKRYYFWETTGKGFELGNLPPEMGEINFWKIELN